MKNSDLSYFSSGKRIWKNFVATAAISVALAQQTIANTEGFTLQGSGTLHWFGIKIYEAKLFAPGQLDPAQLSNRAFALELTYARDFSGKSIADKSIDEIKRLTFGNAEKRQNWQLQMQAIFPNVRTGDRIRGVHRPGAGVSFFHNDKPIGSIEDPEFTQAFFAIWLDPKTAKPSLRRELLGLAESPKP